MKIIIKVLLYISLMLIVYMYCINLYISLSKNDNIISINKESIIDEKLNNYILEVLACEMPASYNEESLKAQAIAIRSFSYFLKDYESSNAQCRINKEEMKNKWNNDFEKYYNKLKNIVNSTSNIVVYKDNKMLKTFYFSTSNGYTEDSKTVFKDYDIKSVESLFDKNSKDYKKEVHYTKNELNKILGDFKNIKIVNRNSTNHVENVLVDNKEYTGIEFRKLLNLRSTDFQIEINDATYCITTYGYGHGVGMSQYGSNYLANEGYDYEYILKYYYGDIVLKNYV